MGGESHLSKVAAVSAEQKATKPLYIRVNLLFVYLFPSQLGGAEQEAPDDAADREPQHLPRPPGPDHRAGVHRPGPVSVRASDHPSPHNQSENPERRP